MSDSIFSKFEDLKTINFNFFKSIKHKEIYKKLNKIPEESQLLSLLSYIKRTNEIEYIDVFVEVATKKTNENNIDDEENNNKYQELIKDMVVFLKQNYEAYSQKIRILLKFLKYDEEFFIKFIDNEHLAVIFGEYVRKYDIDLEVIKKYKNLVCVTFVSYLTATSKFILHKDFIEKFGVAFEIFEHKDLCEIVQVLIDFVKNENSIKLLQNGIAEVIKKSFYEYMRVIYQNAMEGNIDKDNNIITDKNKIFIESAIGNKEFYQRRNFISKIARYFITSEYQPIEKLLEVYSQEELAHIFVNSTPENFFNFMLNTIKKNFLFFYEHSLEYFNNEKNVDALLQIYIIKHRYESNKAQKIDFMNDRIEYTFLKNVENEAYSYSENFVNGFSFLDSLYKKNENDILNFLKNLNFENVSFFEKVHQSIQLNCFVKSIQSEKLSEEIINEMKSACIRCQEIRCELLLALKKYDPIFLDYYQCENISKYKINAIKICLENIYRKTKDKKFYYDYIFTRPENVENLEFNYSDIFHVIENVKRVKHDGVRKGLMKKYDIKEDIIVESEIKKNKSDEIEDKENKIEYNVKNTDDENLNDEEENHVIDILEMLHQNIEISTDYTLQKNDIKHKHRITERIITKVVEFIQKCQKEEILDTTSVMLLNIITIVNLYRDPILFKIVLNDSYNFFKRIHMKFYFSTLSYIFDNLNFDNNESFEVIKRIIDLNDANIFYSFIKKVEISCMYQFFSEMKDNSKLIVHFTRAIANRIDNNSDSIRSLEEQKSTCDNNHDYINEQITIHNNNMFLLYQEILKLAGDAIHKAEGIRLMNTYCLHDPNHIDIIYENLNSKDDNVLYLSLVYLKQTKKEINNKILYELLFKRAKVDNIGEIILEIIEIKEEHLERLYNMFFLDPYKYLNFLPRILDEGFDITIEMIQELIHLLMKVHCEEDRLKICEIINKAKINEREQMNMIIMKYLEFDNYLSKMYLLDILKKHYMSEFDIFSRLVMILGNEDEWSIIKKILTILMDNKKGFYKIIQKWKDNNKLEKLMLRIYPLDLKDKEYYGRLLEKYNDRTETKMIKEFFYDELK